MTYHSGDGDVIVHRALYSAAVRVTWPAKHTTHEYSQCGLTVYY